MKDIVICGAEGLFELADKILANVRLMAEDGFSLRLRSWRKGGIDYISLRLLKDGDRSEGDEELFHSLVATAISDLLVDEWERGLIDRIVERDYSFFLPEDRLVIGERSADLVQVVGLNGDTAYENPRKKAVYHAARLCLADTNILNLEGFINFRLRDYLEVLDDSVARAVDEFLLEKEHDEFVKLLRHIADTQQPQLEHLQVVLGKEGFRLLDGDGTDVGDRYLDHDSLAGIAGSIAVDDVLISTLITLAPKNILIHYEELDGQEETFRILQEVFGVRLSFCAGCKLCDKPNPLAYNQKE